MSARIESPLRLLLTGASGFVGSRLAARLDSELPAIAMLAVRGPGQSSPEFGNLESVDLADEGVASRLVGDFKPNVIVHLAARSSIGEGSREPVEAWRGNFDATRALAAAGRALARQDNVRVRMIFASSAEVYGAAFRTGPRAEDSPVLPITTYGRAKAASEFMLNDLVGEGFEVVSLRLFNHTGPGQDDRFVVPALVKQVAQMEPGFPGTVQLGDSASERDFTDVRDVVEAYARVILSPDAQVEPFSVFNVGSGIVRSVQSIVDHLTELHGAPVTSKSSTRLMRGSDLRRTEGVFDRFRTTFGWEAKHKFDTTIAHMLAYERNRQSWKA